MDFCHSVRILPPPWRTMLMEMSESQFPWWSPAQPWKTMLMEISEYYFHHWKPTSTLENHVDGDVRIPLPPLETHLNPGEPCWWRCQNPTSTLRSPPQPWKTMLMEMSESHFHPGKQCRLGHWSRCQKWSHNIFSHTQKTCMIIWSKGSMCWVWTNKPASSCSW